MLTDRNRIIYLVEKYATKQASENEERELFAILNRVEKDESLQQEVSKIFEETEPLPLDPHSRERMLKHVFAQTETTGTEVIPLQPARKMFTWQRIAAAASIVLVLGTGLYQLVNRKEKAEIVQEKDPSFQTDIVPGSNKATLILADNSVITLDDAQKGTLTQQGNSNITKLDDGQLAYNATGNTTTVLYNTIATPRGGQYQLTLSDGTKVWLNAASSLRFPASFSGKERRVELTGEGYFEVAKNTAMPFKVEVAGKQLVEVLGTHFNINAYNDEPHVLTTLLEGSVKVSSHSTNLSKMLTPGQQAQLNPQGQLEISSQADVEQVMAWKNGKFLFGEGMDIETVMRQFSRWYDVEIEYEGKINGSIGGSISRNVEASQVLKMLEMTRTVKFKIVDRKIIVIGK